MSRRFAEDIEFDRREYRNGPRTAYYDDDVRSTRSTRAPDPRRSQPDFLRDDYGRSTAGPMVLRNRDDFDDRRSSHRGGGGEKEEIIFRERVDRGPPPPPEIDREEIIFRRGEGGRSRAPSQPPPPKSTRSVYEERDEVISRRDDRSRAPPRTEYDREEITFRRGEGDRRSTRDVERDEFIVRRSETERPKPRSDDRDEFIFRRSDRDSRGRDVEKDEFIFRHDDRNGRPGDREEDKIIFKRTERDDDVRSTRSRGASRADIEKDTYISSRTRDRSLPPARRERSLPPPQLAFREREDFVIRRREPSPPRIDREEIVFRHRRPSSPQGPPPPPQRDEREEITIRRREGPAPARSVRSSPPRSPSPQNREEEIVIRRTERSPSPAPPPVPPPPMEPIIRPPIHQEIITHHRHIDHGFERPRSPTPPPEPPSPPKEDHLEIAIRRRDGSQYHEEDIRIDRGGPPASDDGHESHHTRGRSRSLSMTTRRSPSATSRHSRHPTTVVSRRDPLDDLEAEADFYNRKAVDRSYPGEAYNGATKDWAIVDVPPGTERVRMDGIGGGSQEITWQRYNGVRRSKFLTDGQEFPGPFGRPQIGHVGTPKHSKLPPDMWTEITKDLVLKEAIEQAGYDYEETDFFYYVMEYLKYEDVLQLVELSDNIRRDRRQRIREIEWERSQLDRDRKSKGNYDEHVYEREIIYDRGGGRRYR